MTLIEDAPVTTTEGNLLYLPGLSLLAESLNDMERVRIATENRFRSLTRPLSEVDEDGVTRGLGFDISHPTVAHTAQLLDGLEKLEKQTILDIQKDVRTTPFAAWIKSQKGVGEKQAARMLAAIGDPYWNSLYDRPRTVSELWAYCGYSVIGGAAQKRTKGTKANWSADAKMRVYLVATSCVKSTGHYREVYDAARAQYDEAVHPVDCVRCGPAGKPALAGSLLSPGHQHARALRRISKEILKDLWLVGRDYYAAQS